MKYAATHNMKAKVQNTVCLPGLVESQCSVVSLFVLYSWDQRNPLYLLALKLITLIGSSSDSLLGNDVSSPGGGGEGVLPGNLGRGVRPADRNRLTLFQTKICDFPYPISDLAQNFIHYFRPETRNVLGRLPLKSLTEISRIKFWLRLVTKPVEEYYKTLSSTFRRNG